MHIVMFYHSLVSDWNHGNAHFLRGIVTELQERGHTVYVFEPKESWSRHNLVAQNGTNAIRSFHKAFPYLRSRYYTLDRLDLDRALDLADLVIVHEWNDHELVRRIGEHRKRNTGYKLIFHDTHHRSVTDRESMANYDLSEYDGVLAFGEVIRQIYLEQGWTQYAWTWHEAVDTRVFFPLPTKKKEGDLVWVGNWGDEERTLELYEFLIDPVCSLELNARVYGVRYPKLACKTLQEADIEYCGWLPNYRVPKIFSKFRVTVHIPRRPYVRMLPGIPTIRPFEAMACGIPLISAPWKDTENLFTPGKDYLQARNGREMRRLLYRVLNESAWAESIAEHGRQTVLKRHTCAHRVNELLGICEELNIETGVDSTIPLSDSRLLNSA